jgi:hypothetical protein
MPVVVCQLRIKKTIKDGRVIASSASVGRSDGVKFQASIALQLHKTPFILLALSRQPGLSIRWSFSRMHHPFSAAILGQ